jgi:hypothetical protein
MKIGYMFQRDFLRICPAAVSEPLFQAWQGKGIFAFPPLNRRGGVPFWCGGVYRYRGYGGLKPPSSCLNEMIFLINPDIFS